MYTNISQSHKKNVERFFSILPRKIRKVLRTSTETFKNTLDKLKYIPYQPGIDNYSSAVTAESNYLLHQAKYEGSQSLWLDYSVQSISCGNVYYNCYIIFSLILYLFHSIYMATSQTALSPLSLFQSLGSWLILDPHFSIHLLSLFEHFYKFFTDCCCQHQVLCI